MWTDDYSQMTTLSYMELKQKIETLVGIKCSKWIFDSLYINAALKMFLAQYSQYIAPPRHCGPSRDNKRNTSSDFRSGILEPREPFLTSWPLLFLMRLIEFIPEPEYLASWTDYLTLAFATRNHCFVAFLSLQLYLPGKTIQEQ